MCATQNWRVKARLSRRGRWLVVAAVVLVVVGGAAVAIPALANAALFHPNADPASAERLAGNPAMEAVSVPGGYTGWFVHLVDGPAPLVIYFGGNGECAARAVLTYDTQDWWGMVEGANFMMIDYPGYGTSTGRPSQPSMYAMALAALDYATGRGDVDTTRIIVAGYSLGTGPATYLASQRAVAGLILVAPYNNAVSLYNGQVNIFHGPLRWLVTQHFNSDQYAPDVTVAPLIITSRADEQIDHTLAETLATAFPKTPQLVVLDGLMHNDYFHDPGVRSLIRAYVQTVV